jgi:hypothetical protein
MKVEAAEPGLCVGQPRAGEKTTIDGEFYLMSVARLVLKALDAHEQPSRVN